MTDPTPVDRQAVPPDASHAAVLSLGVFVLTVLIAYMAGNGVFGCSSASHFGFGCLGHFVIAGGAGCVIGLLCALAAFAATGPCKWLNWFALLLNGVPLAAILYGIQG